MSAQINLPLVESKTAAEDRRVERAVASELLRLEHEAVDEKVRRDEAPTGSDLRLPEIAWRGPFAEYRDAMKNTTEASDVAHFTALWAAAALSLERRVYMHSGGCVFANVYLLYFGATGDKKTTAQRGALGLVDPSKVISNVGTPEGLAKKLTNLNADPAACLFHWEEFSSLLSRARWKGSSILEFFTETYDAPQGWGLDYSKNPVSIVNPTPTILAATTPEWFWKNAIPDDFHGGFGNRFAYFSGKPKPPMPDTERPDERKLAAVKAALGGLSGIGSNVNPVEARWTAEAQRIWQRFYRDDYAAAQKRTGLLAAALRRLHTHVRKLAMTYAALEGTMPEITADQLAAAIAGSLYSGKCAETLLDSRGRQETTEADLENRIARWVTRNPGARIRDLQQAMSKYATATAFHRVLQSLQRVERIRVVSGRPNRVYPGD